MRRYYELRSEQIIFNVHNKFFAGNTLVEHPRETKRVAGLQNWYNPPRLLFKMSPIQRRRAAEALLCCWLLCAQIWYYSQFKELLGSVASQLLRRLWH
jgi:hypothetical protein